MPDTFDICGNLIERAPWWERYGRGGDNMEENNTQEPVEPAPGEGGEGGNGEEPTPEPTPEPDEPTEMQQGARVVDSYQRRRDAQQLMGRGWAPITFCQQPQEVCERGSSHRSRALRGVLYGKHRVGVFQDGLRHAWVVVHSPVRGFMDRSRCSVLRRDPDGHWIPEGIWAHLLQTVGHCRSLAHLGTVTSWKERLQGTRLVAVAKHRPLLRAAVTTTKGATC